MAQGKKADAEAFLKQVKAKFPDNSVGYRMLGDFYFASGDLDKALTEYAAVFHDHPKDTQVEKNYIQLLILKNRLDDASKLTDAILATNSSDTDALVYRGQIQLRKGQAAGAVQTLQNVLKNDPDNGVATTISALPLISQETLSARSKNSAKPSACVPTSLKRNAP